MQRDYGSGTGGRMTAKESWAQACFGHASLITLLLGTLASPAFAATEISLSLADASFLGEAAGDQAGYSIAGIGDVNGDGYADFLIGAPYNDEGGVDAGQVYLWIGGPYGWARDTQLSDADASFIGEFAGDAAGYAVAGGGDLDGDGLDDFVIGAPYNDEINNDSGKVYLWFGAVGGWSLDTDLEDANTRILAEFTGGSTGQCLDIAGDVGNDGIDDLIIAAPSNNDVADQAGKIYLLFGGAGAHWSDEIDLGTGEASFVAEHEHDHAGWACAGIGDVNDDGYGDIAIGAIGYISGDAAGKVYVIHGQATGWITNQSLSNSDASFLGEAAGDEAGWAIAGAGDLDSDGYPDLVSGAPFSAALGSTGAGQVYIVRGTAAGWSQDQELANSDASIYVDPPYGHLGWSVHGVGDYNGDGRDDFAVGSPAYGLGASGNATVHLFVGGTIVWQMTGPATNALVKFTGEFLEDGAGHSVSGTEDVNGDGADDLLIGAPYSSQVGPDAGKVYLALGDLCSGTDADGDGWTDCTGDCDDSDPTFHSGDADADGFTPCGGDCDDGNADAHPGATEVCDGTADNDCDGQEIVWDIDHDGDGWTSCAGDCDEADASVHPEDFDGDGYSPCDGDCDDSTVDVSPDAVEACDGLDTDCDGELPVEESDADGDGVASCFGDCDDSDPTVLPDADEVCDGLDNNCDDVVDDVDVDGDGYAPVACGGDDCDDSSATTNPDAPESCQDLVDNDCDGLADADDPDCAGDDDDSLGDDDDSQEATDDDASQDQGEEPPAAKGCECAVVLPTVVNPWPLSVVLVSLVVAVTARRMHQR